MRGSMAAAFGALGADPEEAGREAMKDYRRGGEDTA
jgi:hypothetical protein